MGWLGKRRRKKEEKEQEVAEAEAQESVTSGPEVLVLVPEVPGAPTFQVNRFHSADDAVAFVKATVTAELFPSTHIFWAMHEGPPPEVGPMGGEALVLIRAGESREAVHVVSFVDLESAESFARFEVKRGLDVAFVLIYWAAFAQVIETPFGLRLDPPGPPDPRQWRAAAISASHAAPAAPIRRQPAAMQAGDDYGPELRLMRETKLPEAPPRAAPEPEPAAPQRMEPETPPQAVPQPTPALSQSIEPEQAPPITSEPTPAEAVLQEPVTAAGDELQQVAEQPEAISGEAATGIDAPQFQQTTEAPSIDPTPEPAMEEAVAEEPQAETHEEIDLQPEPPTEEPLFAAAEETQVEEQPVEEVETAHEIEEETPADVGQVSVHLELPESEPQLTDAPAEDPVQALDEPALDEEHVVVPPEFAAEPETAAASTNGHHEDEEIPDDFRIEGPVTSTEGDEEVAERLLTEALGTDPSGEEPEPVAEAEQVEEAVRAEPEPVAEVESPPEVEPPAEVEPEPVEPAKEPKRKKRKAKAAAKNASTRHDDHEEDDDDEENIVPVDVNEVVSKTLRVKRWTKQDEPFKGFDSPPGRF